MGFVAGISGQTSYSPELFADEPPVTGSNPIAAERSNEATGIIRFENPDGPAHSFTVYDMAGGWVQLLDNIFNTNFQMEQGNLSDGLYIYWLSNEYGVVGEGKLILKAR